MTDDLAPGDPPDFDAWYRREHPRVLRAVALAAGDVGLGEEATAEAFARALDAWPRVGRMERPGGWVHTVALNELRRTWRRRRLEQRCAARTRAEHEPPPADPEDALWRAVADLPFQARSAVALRYIADLPEAEIADVLNVTRGTVAATLSRARARLAVVLSPDLEVTR